MAVQELDYRLTPRKPKEGDGGQKRIELEDYTANAIRAAPQVLTPHYKAT